MRSLLLALSCTLALGVAPALAQPRTPTPPPAPFTPPTKGIDPNELAVNVANKSTPVLCAEKDNIELTFSSPLVRQFRIQAVHPAYIGTINIDRYAPDFTSCDMSQDPVFKSDARRITFWETPEYWLTGYTYPSFWRPANTVVRVGNREEKGLHMVQLWMKHRERAEEVLVFYPPDGYWRARPLPFADMRWTAYGSSFLVGPVETQERPIVDLKSIDFDPDKMTFTLAFARGGSATIKLDTIDQERMILDVGISADAPKNYPFASMRSMYATEFNSDVARVAWREKGVEAWGESNVMNYKGGPLTEIWAGRVIPSLHNKSAPDMVFGHFSDKPAP
jgi:hypothetical protein